MNDKKNMSRRKALKTMGAFAAGAALRASGLTAANSPNPRSGKKMADPYKTLSSSSSHVVIGANL